jgi:hypothetical protein
VDAVIVKWTKKHPNGEVAEQVLRFDPEKTNGGMDVLLRVHRKFFGEPQGRDEAWERVLKLRADKQRKRDASR